MFVLYEKNLDKGQTLTMQSSEDIQDDEQARAEKPGKEEASVKPNRGMSQRFSC